MVAQVLPLINRHDFERAVRQRSAAHAAKGFSCWGLRLYLDPKNWFTAGESIVRISVALAVRTCGALLCLLALADAARALPQAEQRYPAAEWEKAGSPADAGWSEKALEAAKTYAKTIKTAAIMIVQHGRVVDEWGDTKRPYKCHSIRKSILSALYGIQVERGTIHLDWTMDRLGINDNEPSLNEEEKQATVRQLLQARSGVYHPALYETAAMKAARPKRESHQPGTFWYYNNWDFNALGTIFENLTGRSVFEEFEHRLARPLEMQDFDRARHTRYVTGKDSVHPAYPFQLSARDLARFGLLFARGGRWKGEQIVPAQWVKGSTRPHSRSGQRGGYGYLWWVATDGEHLPGATIPNGSFSARGSGGHYCLVLPEWDLVIVHRVDTFRRGHRVTSDQFGRLVDLILQGRPLRPDEGFDTVFAGGHVMDGTGNPWFRADVAIRNGRIVAVGRLADLPARRTVDVQGLIVAPDFIDMHSHAEEGLASDESERRAAPNVVSQGVTTVVVNQDGYRKAPIAEQRRTFEVRGIGLNAVLFVGHKGLRLDVMKEDFRRTATKKEISQMRRLLKQGMEDGAWGLSAGLEYVPGRWAAPEEMVALVRELAPYDGVYVLHERSSGQTPFWYLPSRDKDEVPTTMVDNIKEIINVSEQTGVKVVATHIKARGIDFWGSSKIMINLINEARARGIRVFADQYPYNTSGSDGKLVLIPKWLSERVGKGKKLSPAGRLRQGLANKSVAADLRRDIAHKIVRRGGPKSIIVMDHPDKSFLGKSLGELAERHSVTPVEMALQLQLKGDPDRRGGARLRSYSMSEKDVEAFAQQPWTATCTDGRIALPIDGPVHPRYYGAFPRKIRHYAIERGIMTVEAAIRSCTSLTAQILGLRDRGQIREGFHADIVVFDRERIRDTATAFKPHQHSAGVVHVLVNGKFVVENGERTGALPGRVLLPRRNDE